MKKSIVISCAGKGSRLGFQIPKCLVKIDGETIIERQLKQIKNVDEIIVVVGYKEDEVVNFVNSLNYNVKFAYNYDYEKTATGASFEIGANMAKNDFIIALDGDLLVHPEDMKLVLSTDDEFVCGESPTTDNPVFMVLNERGKTIDFNREHGELEWSGLAGIYKKNIKPNEWYVCDVMKNILPAKTIHIRAKEVDTINDYNEAVRWVKNNYDNDLLVDNFFKGRFNVSDNYLASRYSINDRDDFDINLISNYINSNSKIIDLGCGTGVLEKKLHTQVKSILGVDKYQEFIDRAFKSNNIQYLVSSLTELSIDDKFDLILLFGVSMYLSDEEFDIVLDKIISLMHKESILIIKNQWGIKDDVIINKYSDNLKSMYYAKYRSIKNVCKLLKKKGFIGNIVDIYPPSYSKWNNTHEYALVLKKEKSEEKWK